MGMAASQARLLTITARIHDVEYKAQTIQNAKMQLATQSDQVYQEYLAALDATTLTIKDIEGNRITANFNNLAGINAVDTGNKYALCDVNGKLIVDGDIKDAYDKFILSGGYDPYKFAMMMINGDGGNSFSSNSLERIEERVYESNQYSKSSDMSSMRAIKQKMEDMGDYNSLGDDEKDEYDALESQYKYKLYKNFGDEIYAQVYAYENSEEDFNSSNFNYYVNIFKQIELTGGCISINEFDGIIGDAANNSEWLNNMIKCGKISIHTVNVDNKTGVLTLNGTSVASDTYLEDTSTSTIDKTALAKAEATYEHKTKEIDQKDKKFDMDLSKLETERTALTTEYDSVKKVISDNIERTFGIFS